jgi:hypothetical protein
LGEIRIAPAPLDVAALFDAHELSMCDTLELPEYPAAALSAHGIDSVTQLRLTNIAFKAFFRRQT